LPHNSASGRSLTAARAWEPRPRRSATSLHHSSTRLYAGGFVELVALALLIVFAGRLWAILRNAEGGSGWLSAPALAGVVTSTAVALGGAMAAEATAFYAGQHGLDANTAGALLDLSGFAFLFTVRSWLSSSARPPAAAQLHEPSAIANVSGFLRLADVRFAAPAAGLGPSARVPLASSELGATALAASSKPRVVGLAGQAAVNASAEEATSNTVASGGAARISGRRLMTLPTSGNDSWRPRAASSSNTSTAMIEFGSTTSRPMSKLMTPSTPRLGATTAANAASASSALAGWTCT
jgi:hypothetical protein